MTEHEQQIAQLERIVNIYREREVVWLEEGAKFAELKRTIGEYWGCEPRENTTCPICKLLKKWEQS